MTHGPERRAIAPDDFPALRDFLAGYLHQDYGREHRTPQGAVQAFSCDATAEELKRLQAEAVRFAAAIAGWPWRDARRAFRDLGAAWAPASQSTLAAFLQAIGAAGARG
jgi:hypothetical protein